MSERSRLLTAFSLALLLSAGFEGASNAGEVSPALAEAVSKLETVLEIEKVFSTITIRRYGLTMKITGSFLKNA